MLVAAAALNCTGIDHSFPFCIRCSSNPKPRKGFGTQDGDNVKKRTTSREQKDMVLRKRKSSSMQSVSLPGQAPGLSSWLGGLSSDPQFEERLQAVRRSALEKKKMEEDKEFGAIDYDAPVEQKGSTIGIGAKIGVGVAVVVFGLVFAFGDFLPSGSISSIEDEGAIASKLSNEERTTLEERLQQYKAALSSSPKDVVALEGAAVTSAELGEYTKAAAFLEDLTKEKPNDPDVFRLLGEVKFELKDYQASEAAYRSSIKMSNTPDFEVLRGLTNALIAAKKPYEERLQQYKAALSSSPKDVVALEGAAVTSAELGEYTKAAAFLEDLTKEKPNDPDVFRLLGEVKFELKDYQASEAAYRSSIKMSNTPDFEVLRGLTNALIAAKKPYEAVQILLEYRKHVSMERDDDLTTKTESSLREKALLDVDPVQVDLLLGKAYSDWGHVNDAILVYDQLISSHPDDFRGYLAKGIVLKENGNVGEAERMFIQARFFAPEKAKSLVGRYSKK